MTNQPLREKVVSIMPVDHTGLPGGRHWNAGVDEIVSLITSERKAAVLEALEEVKNAPHTVDLKVTDYGYASDCMDGYYLKKIETIKRDYEQ